MKNGRTMWIIATCGLTLLFRGLLDFLYSTYVFRFFSGSMGGGAFLLCNPTPLRIFKSYAITFFLTIWLAMHFYRRERPSSVALVMYFLMVILPLLSLYSFSAAPAPFIYAVAGSFIVLMLIIGWFPKLRIPYPDWSLLVLGIGFLAIVSFYVYAWLLLTGSVGRLNFDLRFVYDTRAEYIQTRWPLISYLLPWQAYVINMGIFCYALYRKRRWLIAISGFAQLLMFGMTGHRSYLLVLLLGAGIYMLWSKRNVLFYIIGGTSALILAAYGVFLISGDHSLPSLFIRRLFFVPAVTHLVYYDFFSQPHNAFVMLSNSIFKSFLHYPYGAIRITRVISWAYWGKDFGPNVGYLGDAFAQFGFLGMFLFSIILGVFLRIVDSVGEQLPDNLVAAIIVTPAAALANSALFTSLLTHGLFLAGILLWLPVSYTHLTLPTKRIV